MLKCVLEQRLSRTVASSSQGVNSNETAQLLAQQVLKSLTE